MSTTTSTRSTPDTHASSGISGRPHPAARRGIPLARIISVELRKSFDTRSGFWLVASIGIAALLTSGAVIAWAPTSELAYSQFTLAIGVPISIILPVIATLSVTSEWSQRSGLATFTLVPHRGRVLLAKALASLLVAAASTVTAFAVGAGANLVGSAMAGSPTIWDQTIADVGCFALANTLLMMVGFTLGALIRNSAGAIVSFMIYAFVAPGLLAFLAFDQRWFHDARPWVDAKYNQDMLLRGDGLTAQTWTHLAATTVAWVILPMVAGVVHLLRSEVK
jgi:hypothetical protein